MNTRLLVLFASVLIVMIGFGLTLPVIPFYAGRLALAGGTPREGIAVHVGALTAAYSGMQLIFAPLWGRLSDRVGRRPLVLVGLSGFVIAQALFGLATTMWMLYGARILGGALSSALLPAASAYVADSTTEGERAGGMAWLNMASGLGTVIGPAFSGTLTRHDLHVRWRYGHFLFDSFSVPFLAAALLAMVGLVAALFLFREVNEHPSSGERPAGGRVGQRTELVILLGTAAAGYLGITIFEATLTLFMQERFRYGPGEVGRIFIVCGVAMVLVQLLGVRIARRMGELWVVTGGFAVMGAGLLFLVGTGAARVVFVAVGFIGAGMAFIVPGLSSQLSKIGARRAGATMGLQNAAQSVGQVGGPMLGGVLFGWHARAPFALAGVVTVAVAALLAWRNVARRAKASGDR